MRISNSGRDVTPVYWWSNIAVPEYAGEWLVVPARSAYVSGGRNVEKRVFPIESGKAREIVAKLPDMIKDIREGTDPVADLKEWIGQETMEK